MNLWMRPTAENDLPFVVRIELQEAGSGFVTAEGLGRHMQYLADPDVGHLIIESGPEVVGYLILAGLTDPNENIELRRIVISEKGRGYGRAAVRMAKMAAFSELKAHRLWLDVKTYNERARHLYETEGFVAEGTLRECVKGENGRESVVIMSILKHEFGRVFQINES